MLNSSMNDEAAIVFRKIEDGLGAASMSLFKAQLALVVISDIKANIGKKEDGEEKIIKVINCTIYPAGRLTS
jgi:hypothetical protein